MIPGPSIYRKCPSCEKYITEGSLTSGNTFGAVFWSDGKIEADMLPPPEIIAKCPFCKIFLWLNDHPIIGTYDWFNGEEHKIPDEWKDSKSIQQLTIENYSNAIEDRVFSENIEREVYLRTQLWWLLNDLIRDKDNRQVDIFKKNKLLFKKNLICLYDLLDGNEDDVILQKAEIARELGDFTRCVNILHNVSKDKENIRKEIVLFAQQKSQIVQIINR